MLVLNGPANLPVACVARAGRLALTGGSRSIIFEYMNTTRTTGAEAVRRARPRKTDMDIGAMMENAAEASEFLKALSHEARLVILCMLLDGERSVGELEQALGLRQAAISQQLARLRADDLVEARRDGKNIYYALARPEIRSVIEALHDAFCRPAKKSR